MPGAGRGLASCPWPHARGRHASWQLSREQPYPLRSRCSLEDSIPGIPLGARGPRRGGFHFIITLNLASSPQLGSGSRSGCRLSDSGCFLGLSPSAAALAAVTSPQTGRLETRAVYPLPAWRPDVQNHCACRAAPPQAPRGSLLPSPARGPPAPWVFPVQTRPSSPASTCTQPSPPGISSVFLFSLLVRIPVTGFRSHLNPG